MTQQYPKQPTRGVNPWVWIGLIAVVAVVVAVIAGKLTGRGDAPTVAAPTTTATGGTLPNGATYEYVDPRSTTVPRATTVTPASSCEAAPDGVVQYLDAALSNYGLSLAHPQQVTAPNGDRYIGGDIMRGETHASSSDVWLYRDGVVSALSSDARKYVPDGRRLRGGPSAGDEWGSAVQECVTAARRASN